MKNKKFPELSIIIPLYNEEKRFPKSFKKIETYFLKQKIKCEIVLVDDGSDDKTLKVIRSFKSRIPLKIVESPQNQGKGGALKLGVAASIGKNVFFTDADLSTPLEEFSKLYPHLKKFDMVIGSRRLKGSNVQIKQPFHRRFLGNIFYILFSIFFTDKVKDTNCGFKCYRGDVARRLYSLLLNTRWGFDAELIYIAQKYNYKIGEIPVIWLNDPYSRVSSLNASLKTMQELVTIRINDLLGNYDRTTSKEAIYQSLLQKLLGIFFSVYFTVFGKPKLNAKTRQVLGLYKGSGFQKLFSLIRLWDCPMEEIEREVPKKGVIVDLGCGDGLLTNYIALCSPSRHVIGIEINPFRIREANKGLKNIKFIRGNILDRNIPQADAIILTHVLHHLPSERDQEILLQSCNKKLKKGGKLIVTEIAQKPILKYLFTWFTDAFIVPILFERKLYDFNFIYRTMDSWLTLFRHLKLKTFYKLAHSQKPFSHILLVVTK